MLFGNTLSKNMYFADLSKYVYLGRGDDSELLNVGWLDKDHPFPTGPVPASILMRILALCFRPVNGTRGYFQSPFINQPSIGYSVSLGDKTMLLGSAEIRVPGEGSKCYAAPNLIFHYIKDCNYRPPDEFLEAVAKMAPSSFGDDIG